MCESSPNITNELKLLIDKGSGINLIKMNCSNRELLINKNKKIFLKGIIKNLTETIGQIITPIIIDNTILKVEFDLIKKDFSCQETVY